MSRVETTFDIAIDVAACKQKLEAAGWEVSEVGESIEATHGSQARMRLAGGWFIGGDKLPKKLVGAPGGEGTSIRVEDTMGVGFMDPLLKKKYASTFAELETQLS